MDSVVVGLNIKSAPIRLLEKLSIHHSLNASCARDVKSAARLSAAVVLSTCNRLEFYVTADDPERGAEEVWGYFTSPGAKPSPSTSARCCARTCTPTRATWPCAICSK